MNNSSEIAVIKRLLANVNHNYRVVDIGAGDLSTFSNSADLLNEGWKGYLFENKSILAESALKVINDNDFDAAFVKAAITHENILSLLEGLAVPRIFSVLSIDIDSFDALVVRKILTKYEPLLVIIEINERIPPTVDYELLYDPIYIGKDLTLYASASISRMCAIFDAFEYHPTELLYNNLVCVSNELKPTEQKSPLELWKSGFFNTNWREHMPWNIPFEFLWALSPNQAEGFLRVKTQELGLKVDIRSAFPQ